LGADPVSGVCRQSCCAGLSPTAEMPTKSLLRTVHPPRDIPRKPTDSNIEGRAGDRGFGVCNDGPEIAEEK